ncbi:MAG: type II toxin-antitoxin system HicB family antitoxin [Paludibacter sp.]|jgi:predicted RNase H-like HicB family nuclease|nr:type II toxin-antitoxin system HicB family antitoxin [Paludibacter sp.]
MNKVKAFIERGNDGTYGVYVDLDDNTLNYGIHGDGNSVEEAIEDFKAAYLEMQESFKKDNNVFAEADFDFYYDIASFLSYNKNMLSLAGLSRLTGINQGQLSHYVTGRKKPTRRTVEKMQFSINQYGKELSQVSFI